MMKVLALAVMAVGLVNCSKDKNSSNTTVGVYTCYNYSNVPVANSNCATTNSTYQNYNNTFYCKDSSGNVVANTYCATGATGSYTMLNNQCYQTSNGQYIPVAYNYCATSTTGMAQQCSGIYYYNGGAYNCGVTHTCSGVIMQNQAGQTVQCL